MKKRSYEIEKKYTPSFKNVASKNLTNAGNLAKIHIASKINQSYNRVRQ
jgi:hypothetical protein